MPETYTETRARDGLSETGYVEDELNRTKIRGMGISL